MVMYLLLLLTSLAARSWADDFQPILTQISTGKSDCNTNELLGNFDLRTVPQFNALCNIQAPDIQQSEFLLENNVIPVLCMGLLDVSLRLCKIAKNDISKFEDIFPPTTAKFNGIFVMLSKMNNFSLADEFCSTTVNNLAIKEAASNATDMWWKILNEQLSNEKFCSNICHSNEGNKVNPLCSYILWANGIYLNYQKNQVGQATALGDDKPLDSQRIEEPVNQAGKSNQDFGFGENDLLTKTTVGDVRSDLTSSSGNITQLAEGTKSELNTDNNIVGVGTVEQLINVDQASATDTTNINVKPSEDQGKLVNKASKPKSKQHKAKEIVTASNPTEDKPSKVGATSTIQVNAPLINQTEVKVDAKASAVEMSSNLDPENNVRGSASGVPESQKQDGVKQGPLPGKMAGEETVEADPSLDMTPAGAALDQPLGVDKDFQPVYSEEEAEDGDGDDVEVVDSKAQASANTASNGSNTVISKINSVGVAIIQQGPLEGDKVYGEGDIVIEDHFIEAEDSHFFTYFLCMAVLTIMAYLAFHNKKKLIALAVEGRRTKGGRRRPNSSHYSKLDCSLEEALVSNTTASVTHVLY